MQFQMEMVTACDVMAPLAAFGIWLVLIGGCYGLGRVLLWLPRRAQAVVATVFMVIVGSVSLFAISPDVNDPARCAWLINMGTPCWLLLALWCPCEIPPPPPLPW